MATHSASLVARITLGLLAISICLASVECKEEGSNKDYSGKETIITTWMDSYSSKPDIELTICYKHDSCVKDDDIYTLDETWERPLVRVTGKSLDAKAKYCLILVDVDSYNPKNALAKPELHWLVYDISGDVKQYQDISISGVTEVPYLRPRRSYYYKGIYGEHRMYLLLFKQGEADKKIEYDGDLKRTSLRKFTKKYNLGYPEGGVTYYVNFTSKGHFHLDPLAHH